MFNKRKVLLYLGIAVMAFIVSGMSDIVAAEKKRVIVIDAGHGGKDRGVQLNDKIAEKDITLAIALFIQQELAKEKNIDVVLTRNSDKQIDLEDRRKMIEKIKPDFLISLHVNAGFGKNASGFEIYYPALPDMINGEKNDAKNEKSKLQNKLQNDSLKMAKILQDALNALFPRKGRGLRKADLPLTEGLNVSALSLEMSFATNAEEQKKLLSAKTQEDIAKALAKGIKHFFR
ncbi:MAG: N-acetylmuramoyl-L-alanine amidase [Syntrophaceae bacterium]|nr:N-acetylmuramoyl-L-alanine amidase [Syntrophaceae bacterium]